MIRAVFWDNDGVLVDTEEIYYQATRELLLTTGVELTEEAMERCRLTPDECLVVEDSPRGLESRSGRRASAAP